MLWAVLVLAAAFGIVNGVHDAGNAIAAPIVTGALRPGPAVVLAAVFHVAGALLLGTAVAATVAGIIEVPEDRILAVLGAAVLGALMWSLATLWWGLPCSSGHCLVGALAGAALAEDPTIGMTRPSPTMPPIASVALAMKLRRLISSGVPGSS